MPVMPTRDKLSYAIPRPSQAMVPGQGADVANAVQGLGTVLGGIGDKLRVDARLEKAKSDTVQLAQARSHYATQMAQEKGTYTLDQNPKYGDWGKKAEKATGKHLKDAEAYITDPLLQKKFRLEVAPGAATFTTQVDALARGHWNDDLKAKLGLSIDQDIKTAAGQSREDAGKTLADIGQNLKEAVKHGVYTPGEAAKVHLAAKQTYATFRATRDGQERPEKTFYHLTGGADRGVYLSKLSRVESSNNPNAKNPTRGVTSKGLYGFDDKTWSGVMNNYKHLGLTENGRGNVGQETKAILALTDEHARALGKAKMPDTEANLYVMHFMGGPAGKKLLKLGKTNPTTLAFEKFKAEARDNPTKFYKGGDTSKPRTIEEVLGVLTRGFAGDYGAAPPSYKDLPVGKQLQLISATSTAATAAHGDAEKDFETAQAQRDVDAVINLPVADGWKAIKELPSGRRDRASRLYSTELSNLEKAKADGKAQLLKDTHGNIMEGIEAGKSTTELEAMIPDGMDPAHKEAMRKKIADRTEVPDQIGRETLLNKLRAMQIKDGGKEFAAITEAQWLEYLKVLTRADIDDLMARQAKFNKGPGKRASAASTSNTINTWLRSVGVNPNAGGNADDATRTLQIRAAVLVAIDAQETALDRELKPLERDEVIAQAFMSTARQRNLRTLGLTSDPVQLDDVANRFIALQDTQQSVTLANAAKYVLAQDKKVTADELGKVAVAAEGIIALGLKVTPANLRKWFAGTLEGQQ